MAAKNGVEGQEAPVLAPSTAPPLISRDQLIVIVRYVLTAVASYGVGRHWFTAAQASDMVNVLISVGAAIVPAAMTMWGVLQTTKSAKVAAVQAMPDMQVVTTSDTIKQAIPAVVKVPPTKPVVVAPKP